MIMFETADAYGNPAPVMTENLEGGYVTYKITSDESGWKVFAAPNHTSGWNVSSGTARMTLGESTTSFYYIGTIVGTHTFTVERPGWWSGSNVGTSSYTVKANRLEALEVYTPGVGYRRMIANTTVQWYPDYLD